ncbi:MAG: hypothetical protein ACI8T1_002849 [Verrucomicrobiales bacterium]|jgi:hypothetical protein
MARLIVGNANIQRYIILEIWSKQFSMRDQRACYLKITASLIISIEYRFREKRGKS